MLPICAVYGTAYAIPSLPLRAIVQHLDTHLRAHPLPAGKVRPMSPDTSLGAIPESGQSPGTTKLPFFSSSALRPALGAVAGLCMLVLSGCAVYASPYGGYIAPTTVGVVGEYPVRGPRYPAYVPPGTIITHPGPVVVTGPRYPVYGRPGYGHPVYGRPSRPHRPIYIRPPYASRPDYPRNSGSHPHGPRSY